MAVAALLSTSRAAEGGQHGPDHCGVHLAHLWRSSDVPSPLRGGIFGSVGRSHRCASGHPKISDGGVCGPARLALASDDTLPLDRGGRVLGRVSEVVSFSNDKSML
ncbi:unnamed protein product [Miscanthus lutarioriparius]|uniref:Uncharacterized protein n=1 Tax=Miscanthus lutarioriparius TaxID=422564 RepID=A0A811SAZ7_9POAL|nr:unnamed protein product [Miscanthus lutarioriparius]